MCRGSVLKMVLSIAVLTKVYDQLHCPTISDDWYDRYEAACITSSVMTKGIRGVLTRVNTKIMYSDVA